MPDYEAPMSDTVKIVTDEFADEVQRRVQQNELGGLWIRAVNGDIRVSGKGGASTIKDGILIQNGDVLDSFVPLQELHVQADGSSTVTVRVTEQPWRFENGSGVTQ